MAVGGNQSCAEPALCFADRAALDLGSKDAFAIGRQGEVHIVPIDLKLYLGDKAVPFSRVKKPAAQVIERPQKVRVRGGIQRSHIAEEKFTGIGNGHRAGK